jgi:AP-4 complex subunit mu-1
MSLSQFFILSPRGDVIISKDFRGDSLPGFQEAFFRKVKFWDRGDAPPVFLLDDITFMYIRRNSLLIAATTKYNISPSENLELLNRLAKVFKDYCGVLTEESIRKNFILIYELLDEMLDFGYPQLTSTESLKSCVHNEPIMVAPSQSLSSSILNSISSKTKAANATSQPLAVGASRNAKSQKNEIYVDIIERLTLLVNSAGVVSNCSIDGSIMMKSFLSGNPELRVALNEDLVIGKGGAYGSVVLDDCNFHDCVRLDEFESGRILHFTPPDGEFSMLNYRITADFRPPFKVYPLLEEPAPYKLELSLTIRAEIPELNHGANVVVRIPMPRNTVIAIPELSENSSADGNSAVEYNTTEKRVYWTIRKFNGGSELSLKVKITLDSLVSAAHKREVGPISMGFEIPMYNVSHLQVRYLRISETHKSYNPYRWVRYITQSSSYVCRLQG